MKSLLSRYSDRIGSNVGDMCRHRLIGIGLNIPPGCPYQIHPLTKIGKHIAGNHGVWITRCNIDAVCSRRKRRRDENIIHNRMALAGEI